MLKAGSSFADYVATKKRWVVLNVNHRKVSYQLENG
jgi:hypothetical protein